eukprot:1041332-Prorocentrum_minimum.AAC.7
MFIVIIIGALGAGTRTFSASANTSGKRSLHANRRSLSPSAAARASRQATISAPTLCTSGAAAAATSRRSSGARTAAASASPSAPTSGLAIPAYKYLGGLYSFRSASGVLSAPLPLLAQEDPVQLKPPPLHPLPPADMRSLGCVKVRSIGKLPALPGKPPASAGVPLLTTTLAMLN